MPMTITLESDVELALRKRLEPDQEVQHAANDLLRRALIRSDPRNKPFSVRSRSMGFRGSQEELNRARAEIEEGELLKGCRGR